MKPTTPTSASRRQFLKTTAVGAGALAAPAILRAQNKVSGTVYVESWGGSYADAVRDYILEPFKKEFGVDYKHTFFGNNSEQLAKLKTGNSRVDMTFLSDSFILRGAQAKALQPLDLGAIPNYGRMYDKFQKPTYDPGPDVYSVAYFYGDTAIAYNEDMLKSAPDSWEAMWDPQFKGRVVAYGSGSGPVYLGALATGQNINDIKDLDIVEKRLNELKPNLLKWWSSGAECTELFATGEAFVGNFWRGRVNNLRKEGHPIQYVQPKEGTSGWVDTMAIPTTAENKAAAAALINFALEPEVQKNFVLNGISYAPTNGEVKLSQEEEARLGASNEILSRITFVDPEYNLKNIDKWTEIANRVKA
ncbi:MAG: extracellular solute-binding protein [Ectothiorhodospiraceae bacterium]|nr:extracellular solute-binding protein [Chromatiales bacterium]MCP5154339.1 extracellular solute-binding protein [Ectothiorhodospiraceae bacterium]